MDFTLFVFMLFALQAFYWLVGRRAAKHVDGQEDYFLAGKNVRLFPLMMTFLATQVGGGVILGSADEAYRFGWPVLLFPLGSALGLILLGSGLGRRLAGFQVSTVAQIFEVVYGSVVLRQVASVLSVISLFMILVAQIIASGKFLVSMGMDSSPLFILFWAIVILYTAQGGLKAVISTDMVQAAFFSGVFLLCFGYVLCSDPSISLVQAPQLESFAAVSPKLCGWLLMPLLFMVIEQDMGQRCFAGASPAIVSKASFFAGIFTMIICVVPVFMGSLANVTGLEVPQGGSVLMAVIAKTTNPWITALVGCAVLAAIISTATSLINAISSNVSSDFKLAFLQDKKSMFWVKGVTGLISISAIFFAFFFDNVVDVLIHSYELSVSCLFVPVFMALLRKRGDFMSAALAMIGGAVAFVVFQLYPTEFPREIVSILLSAAGYVMGELAVRHSSKMTHESA
ncbi:MAG: sodium:solute symporter family protein [Chlamydiales bacterium]|nr:sodium:solute symporter family protein [Chlamydiales bacterium]